MLYTFSLGEVKMDVSRDRVADRDLEDGLEQSLLSLTNPRTFWPGPQSNDVPPNWDIKYAALASPVIVLIEQTRVPPRKGVGLRRPGVETDPLRRAKHGLRRRG